MCVCKCVCAERLNFAADQAEIEIFHGLKKTAARESGSEAETGGRMDGEWKPDEENARRKAKQEGMKE